MNRALLLILLIGQVFGVSAKPADPPSVNARLVYLFMENKGQIHGPDNELWPHIIYQMAANGVNVSLTGNSIHYTFYKSIQSRKRPSGSASRDTAAGEYETIGMDMVLLGANAATKVTGEHEQDYNENYYTTAMGKAGGLERVRSFAKVIYHNVYPHIDFVVNAPENEIEGGLKYCFVVHEGGNPADIQLRYSNSSSLSLQADGSLLAQNEIGTINASAPYSFIRETGLSVSSPYKLSGNVVSFSVPRQDSGTLVIYPQVMWADYFGAAQGEIRNDVVTYQGDAYIVGSTLNFNNIASSSDHKTHLSGITDAYLSRVSNTGNLLWSTYFRGGPQNGAHAVAIDSTTSGIVYMCGTTKNANIKAASGTVPTRSTGGVDGFIAKFNLNGSLIRATYYSGQAMISMPVFPARD